MKLFQLIDQDGDHVGLFNCPDSVNDLIFFKSLESFEFDLDLFEENNDIQAERIFAERVDIP